MLVAFVWRRGRATLWRVVLLGGFRFTGPPFLGRKKAHARAETLVIAGRLAGVFERGVAAGLVPTGTHFSRQLR